MVSKSMKMKNPTKIKLPTVEKGPEIFETDKLLVLQNRNVEEFQYAIPTMSKQLLYLSLARQFCENYISNSNRQVMSCDCVNLATNQLLAELYPSTTYSTKHWKHNGGSCPNGKSLKHVDFTSAIGLDGDRSQRNDDIFRWIMSKIENLRSQIRFNENKIRATIAQLEK